MSKCHEKLMSEAKFIEPILAIMSKGFDERFIPKELVYRICKDTATAFDCEFFETRNIGEGQVWFPEGVWSEVAEALEAIVRLYSRPLASEPVCSDGESK